MICSIDIDIADTFGGACSRNQSTQVFCILGPPISVRLTDIKTLHGEVSWAKSALDVIVDSPSEAADVAGPGRGTREIPALAPAIQVKMGVGLSPYSG
jgi:hypothetical protein